MPFTKVDPISEAIELQELFKDDAETKEVFRQYELAHIGNARIKDYERKQIDREGIKVLTQENIRTAIQTIAPKYCLEQVYLFGSYARGDATEASDCDFRIVGGNIRDLYDIADLRLDLEEILGKKIDLILTKNMSEAFHKKFKDEEVQIYG